MSIDWVGDLQASARYGRGRNNGLNFRAKKKEAPLTSDKPTTCRTLQGNEFERRKRELEAKYGTTVKKKK